MRLLSSGIGAQFRNSHFEQVSAGIMQIPTSHRTLGSYKYYSCHTLEWHATATQCGMMMFVLPWRATVDSHTQTTDIRWHSWTYTQCPQQCFLIVLLTVLHKQRTKCALWCRAFCSVCHSDAFILIHASHPWRRTEEVLLHCIWSTIADWADDQKMVNGFFPLAEIPSFTIFHVLRSFLIFALI